MNVIWMRAAEFDQRGVQLPHHAVRRHVDGNRWVYDEQTLCGRPVPKNFGLSLLTQRPTDHVCTKCGDLAQD